MAEDVEVVVMNKGEMEDMIKELLQQISVLREKIDEIEARLGTSVGENAVEETEEETEYEEEKSLDAESKPVAPQGQTAPPKKETMNVNENEPVPPADTGSIKPELDKIKGMVEELKGELMEIKKNFNVVSTPMPDADVNNVSDSGDEIRKSLREILEGKATLSDVKRKIVGGV